ncbi:MAG: hypothetical protein ACE5EG_09480 [Thermoanaerobaculia bacterium]
MRLRTFAVHRRRFVWLLAVSLALPGVAAFAEEAPYLLALEGPPVTVRYSPGSLDRADQVKRRLTRLVAETGHRKLKQPLLVVELLRAEEWRQAGLAEPYGLPAISGTGSLALPAWGEAETVALWRKLLEGWLPSGSGTPLRGSIEEAASLEAADLVGEVEASRIILSRLGLSGSERWVDDLLACALALSASRRYEPARWAELRQFHARLAAHPEAARDERPSAARRRRRADRRRVGQAARKTVAQDGRQEARTALGGASPRALSVAW